MKWAVPAIALLIVAALVMAVLPKRASWHQKLTLHIETPDGPVTASNVVEVTFKGRLKVMDWMDGNRFLLRGEAVTADLGGRPLFALLGGRETLVWRTLGYFDRHTQPYDTAYRQIKQQAEPLAVPRKYWPQLMTFADVSDAKSVQAVDPDDLAATFGAGYALTRIEVQVTREPVTEGPVEGMLGWLSEFPELKLCKPDGRTTNIPLCMRVEHSSFLKRLN